MADEQLLHIGELAAECQTTTRTLRYYEALGLIGPPLRARGQGSFRREAAIVKGSANDGAHEI
jgi:hypothetical protein